MQESARPYITVRSVSKVYRAKDENVQALKEINLEIAPQEFVSMVGPSGCGKSTLILLIGGLIKPTSGTIEIAGKPVNEPITDVGMVFQDPVLLEWRTALDNVLLQAKIRGLDESYYERAKELLVTVGLSGFEHKYPWELSGGMRQRVSICRALLHRPPLLLMDEPFGALDALTRDTLGLELLKLWEAERKTVLFVTHDIREATFLSNRVIVFSPRPGRIVAELDIDLAYPRGPSLFQTREFLDYTAEIRRIFEREGVLRGD